MNAPPPPPPGERGDEFGGSIMDDAPGVAMEYKVRPIVSIQKYVAEFLNLDFFIDRYMWMRARKIATGNLFIQEPPCMSLLKF